MQFYTSDVPLFRQVPTDAEVVAAVVEDGRVQRMTPPSTPSTFATDCAAIFGPAGSPLATRGQRASSDNSDCSVGTPMGGGGRCSIGRCSMGCAVIQHLLFHLCV